MTNFIISGTSGVGKSFLEQWLEKKMGFYQLIKYMDRDPRPVEVDNPKVGFYSKSDFQKYKNEGRFVFTLEYSGNNYGWTKEDVQSNSDKHLTIAITLDALGTIFKSELRDFIPMILTVPSNQVGLGLLEKRLIAREGVDDMSKLSEGKKLEIAKRMELAKVDLLKVEKYKDIVIQTGGKVFEIIDDNTLFEEVVPWIKSFI